MKSPGRGATPASGYPLNALTGVVGKSCFPLIMGEVAFGHDGCAV